MSFVALLQQSFGQRWLVFPVDDVAACAIGNGGRGRLVAVTGKSLKSIMHPINAIVAVVNAEISI